MTILTKPFASIIATLFVGCTLSLGLTYAKAAEPVCISASSVIAEVSKGGIEVFGIPPSTYHYEAERATLATKWTLSQADLTAEQKDVLAQTNTIDITGYPGKGWRVLFSKDGCAIGLMDMTSDRAIKLFDMLNSFKKVNG